MIVLSVDNEQIRQEIEQWTQANTQPDVIQFVQDGAGAWIVGTEVLTNPKFEPILSLIMSNSTQIEYTPITPPDESI